MPINITVERRATMTITKEQLDNILKKHTLWVENESGGERANLSGTDLRGANLYAANLSGTDLRGANLYAADLYAADLRGANLYATDLRGANLYAANLRGTDLSGANLRGAKNLNLPMACPEEGSFIGFKKCRNNFIVKLEILSDSLRCSATGRKCRCSKAKVISITNLDGTNANTNAVVSKQDPTFIYKVGETVEVKNFDTNRWNECSTGIHFFITRQEAVDYVY